MTAGLQIGLLGSIRRPLSNTTGGRAKPLLQTTLIKYWWTDESMSARKSAKWTATGISWKYIARPVCSSALERNGYLWSFCLRTRTEKTCQNNVDYMLSVDFFLKVKINCYKWNISSLIEKNIRKVNRDICEVSVDL